MPALELLSLTDPEAKQTRKCGESLDLRIMRPSLNRASESLPLQLQAFATWFSKLFPCTVTTVTCIYIICSHTGLRIENIATTPSGTAFVCSLTLRKIQR